jgi:hypothetical protein
LWFLGPEHTSNGDGLSKFLTDPKQPGDTDVTLADVVSEIDPDYQSMERDEAMVLIYMVAYKWRLSRDDRLRDRFIFLPFMAKTPSVTEGDLGTDRQGTTQIRPFVELQSVAQGLCKAK